MVIQLIESGRTFSEENISELKRLLSKVPCSHLDSLEHIERVAYSRGLADSSPFGSGGEIRLPSVFYHLDEKERGFTFLHELGHNYFDFRDWVEGDRAMLRFGHCRRQDVSHLLRVQWMELGWELNPENWEKVKAEDPENGANKDKYTYVVKYGDPNKAMGEWTCMPEARIPKDSFQDAFRYNKPFYSPKEEMADAYALFILERSHFLKAARKSKLTKAKYDFIKKCFMDNSKKPIILKRN